MSENLEQMLQMNSCNTPTLEQQLREKLPKLNYTISKEFLGIFDGIFDKEYCQNWIDYFDKVDSSGMSYSRVQGFNRPSHVTEDHSVDFTNCSIYTNSELRITCRGFNEAFWGACYPLYAEKYSVLQQFDAHKIYTIKIQKTVPGGGYHAWHCEDQTRDSRSRLLTFILYLNDVEEGGETEFLYLSKRIKPASGRLVIWPSGFTHTHRGNPPLSGEKYIITGWIEF